MGRRADGGAEGQGFTKIDGAAGKMLRYSGVLEYVQPHAGEVEDLGIETSCGILVTYLRFVVVHQPESSKPLSFLVPVKIQTSPSQPPSHRFVFHGSVSRSASF